MWTMGTAQLALTICSCALASVSHYRRSPGGKETPRTRRYALRPNLKPAGAPATPLAGGLQAASSRPVKYSAVCCCCRHAVEDCRGIACD